MNNKQITLATLVLNLMYEYQEKHNITKEYERQRQNIVYCFL